MAKGCSKKPFLERDNDFPPLFNHKWIKIMLIEGKSKFLLALSRIIFFPEGTETNPTFCKGKTRFTHVIAVTKRANSHNFEITNLNFLTITFVAIYLLNS